MDPASIIQSIGVLLPVAYSVINDHIPDIVTHFVAAELHEKAKGLYDDFHSRGPELNHDLQRAFRLAYLNATRQLIRAAKDSLPPAPAFLSLTERDEQAPLLEKLENAVESERKHVDDPAAELNIPRCQPEHLLAKRQSSATERFQELLHQDLINDIGRWLPGQKEPPPAILKCLNEGWTDIEFGVPMPRTWLGYMAEAFLELLKDHRNERLRTVFETHLLIGMDGKLDEIIEKLDEKKAAADLKPLFQLPRPPADFTGRESELAELRAAVETGGVTISGLQGQGGVGKTALALTLAGEIAPRYPDAQIFVDLKGVSEKPLTPGEAMAHVIRAFHPDPEAKLPESEADLGGIYRNLLYGKRVLLLMDNARDAAQVRPLIPPQSCLLLVTSRQHFHLPGLKPKTLDVLPSAEAKQLLLTIAPRIDAEAEAIAKLCGYLPLALRLAASALAARVDLAPAEYARRLVSERLKLLGAKDKSKDESVEASINLSYGLLGQETQLRWRTLGVFPDTFDALAAATVWGMEEDGAQDAAGDNLGELIQYSLLEWNDKTERYRLHDLMRDFARARLTLSERDAAARRHARHYKGVLTQADDLFLKGHILRGLALFDLEWTNIQAGQAWAVAAIARAPDDPQVAGLCNSYPRAGVYCLDLRLHTRHRIRWFEEGLAAARRLKDRPAEASHLGNLGTAYHSLGETHRAIEFYQQQLRITREIGDRYGDGKALGNLGLGYAALGETRRAIEYYHQSFLILREIGDRRSEGASLGNLGLGYAALGETRRAIEFFEQHLAIAREIGDRRGEGAVLNNLGLVYGDLGETRPAVEYFERSLAIQREIGDRRGEGKTLGNLGLAYFLLGETRRAIEFHEQQLRISREIGDRRGEGHALFNKSRALDNLAQRKVAIVHAEAALQIFEQIEDPNAAQVKRQLDQWK